MNYIKREIEPLIKEMAKTFSAVAISGPRQVGKSTVLQELFSESHHYITLDNPLLREQAINDPKLFIESSKKPLIIDEVQYAPQLIDYIKIDIDENRTKKGRYILTGSQQFTLQKNLSDSLAGRVGLINLPTFTIEEYQLSIKAKTTPYEWFMSACLEGLYPELVVNKGMNTTLWYSSYLQTYLERDIRTIHDIGNLRDFQRLLRLLAARTAQTINYSDYSNSLDVTVPTIKKWISILEASGLIYLLSPYHNNFGKRIIKSPKLYFTDIGFACYLNNLQTKSQIKETTIVGNLFENFCIQETLKIYYNKGIRPPIYFFRDSNGLEIDLIIDEHMTLIPYEIKFTKTPKKEMAKPMTSFQSLKSTKQISDGHLIYLDSHIINLTNTCTTLPFESYLDKLKTKKK